jgi:hypothetical protein
LACRWLRFQISVVITVVTGNRLWLKTKGLSRSRVSDMDSSIRVEILAVHLPCY